MTVTLSAADQALLVRRRRVLGAHAPLFYDTPLHIVRGQGVWLEDAEGRRYLDVYNNVAHVGHAHPRVVAAIAEQAATLNTHTRYLHERVVEYAEQLLATVDAPLSVAQFCCTGTEANELALRMARFGSGSQGVIVSDFSYHGNSATLAALTTGLPAPESLAPWVRTLRIPDTVGVPQERHAAILDQALAELDAAIASLQDAGYGVAALLVDTIFSTEGLVEPPSGYLRGVAQRIRAAGGYVIGDEVQPGFGRMGDAMWGYHSHGIVPDFMTMGKPMANGHPVAGVITRGDILEDFGEHALYFNTFGGNPVSAAAGLAVLDVIRDGGLLEHSRMMGANIRSGLGDMARRHPAIGSVRGRGLFFGLEIVRPDGTPDAARTRRIVNRMREEGVLLSRTGRDDNVLKMRPALVFDQACADLLLETLDQVVGEG
ncbi:aminotransferase class III-fold pyridoxal phosphate-dependent enzyme [Gluconacetobacter entanii]|uniref:Aminotransferase class III-fold pyridoxal phosphate-dependent enzyme n=1 Tax=Gluconacetobacter entanii TaxID=108528 RepID=A0ABT3K4X7_9PROT|nr:aminotransferase class III-fold pyridoxal phosphate-dependent enzyme [Gluconacetobacter entanii]MCW4590241.1 aminotransferase class III-fold pyridoxal phosphate-dependent enzyme [Gluconacetobacter entanii]MCW4594286.1 aminotransferase class III-fold pyridoxal phosphate-dependent enzyme [Gluconacetobacter entanii]NPC89487.1 aminotransferase class III-fold pyridoxal phosphate-dependent enzyme [Gluconacetobacter entanii]